MNPSNRVFTAQPLRAILWGGVWCGVLDIAAAMISARLLGGASSQRILQTIAGGLIGTQAFEGGWNSATLGLVFHFVISFGAAGVYVALAQKFPGIHRHVILSGLGFGFVCYWFMSGVVLPLSALHAPIPTAIGSARVLRPIAIHLLFVGLPIALAARRWGAPASAK